MSENAKTHPNVTPTPASGRGWSDYLAGLPFPADFDDWGEIEQRHYERGRLRAAGAPARFRAVPASEPANVIRALHGLGLIPKKARVARPPVCARKWY